MDSSMTKEGDTGVKLTLIYVIGPGDVTMTTTGEAYTFKAGTLVAIKSRKVYYGIKGTSATFVVMVKISGPKDDER